jgi:glycosyltransferase involved in cell wall biosynthesis
MKAVILMTYLNRPESLQWTLKSFLKYDPKDFEVLIIDDNSKEDIKLPDLPYKVRVIKFTTEPWVNIYTALLNMGFTYALDSDPDIIIMQHSECYHVGDVLGKAKKITDQNYISFGCYALGKCETPGSYEILNRPCTMEGERSWYNHPVYRAVGYNFCSAITSKNLIKLNGFDERFKDGNAFEDDYFLHQIAMLGLKVEVTADPFVLHQYHPVMWNPAKWPINQRVFETLRQGKEYRAKHLLTPDL